MEKFYIMVDNQQDGPYTKEEIINKGFSDSSYVYNKTLGGWKKISEISNFFSVNIDVNTKEKKSEELVNPHENQNKKNSNESIIEIKDNYKDFKITPKIKTKNIFNLFKTSNFSKAYSELKNNNLIPQAKLLKQAKRNGYQVNSTNQRDIEISMLKSQNISILAAMNSIGRFKNAKEICIKNDLEKAAIFFDFYIDLYFHYIKSHNN